MATPWTIDIGDLIERVVWTAITTFAGLASVDALAGQINVPTLWQLYASFASAALTVLSVLARQRLKQLGPIE